MTCVNPKVTPTNDTNYRSCSLFNELYEAYIICHIIPLDINKLGQTYTYKHRAEMQNNKPDVPAFG